MSLPEIVDSLNTSYYICLSNVVVILKVPDIEFFSSVVAILF